MVDRAVTRPAARQGRRPDAQTVVYAVLALATVVSWLLGTEESAAGTTPVGIAALTIAFVKIRLVGLSFMELRAAPRGLRWIFEGYALAVFAMLLTLFLLG
jgi:hypothetical protein